MKQLLAIALGALLPVLAAAEATTWTIDPSHSTSGFTVKHLVVSTVRGGFGKTTGAIHLDDADLTRSTVEANIDASSIHTGSPDRDKHLESADFFDVANHPTITFKSTRVEKVGDDKLKVTGDLTMRGVTKPIVLDVSAPSQTVKGMKGELRRGFSATGKLNRKDYGLNWSKMIEAGPVVSDEVNLQLDVEATKDEAKGAAGNKAEKAPPKAGEKTPAKK